MQYLFKYPLYVEYFKCYLAQPPTVPDYSVHTTMSKWSRSRFQVTIFHMNLCCPVFFFTHVLLLCAEGEHCLRRSGTDMIPKARMKTLKMSIVIVSSFVICWTPYYLLGVWYWFQPEMIQHTPEYIHHILFVFGNLNTCCDPVIYGFYTPSFRADLADVVACCRGRRANNASPRSVDRLSCRNAGGVREMESDLSSNQHSGNPS